MHTMENSKNFLRRAKNLIPALSQTFSKAPYSYVEGVYPAYLSRGRGSHVFDVDNNEYIDYVLALGPIILGYNYPKVDNAIKKQLKNGISFSIPHTLEVELSEKIQSIIPGTEMVRLSKMIRKFNYNNIESLKILFENWHGEIATVYIEPITLEYPKNNFLQKVKQLARKHGAVLIFDEVITGFRFANGGAQELLKIEADLVVFGKGIANGMPLGAITGKTKFMEQFNDVFYSTTYGGETLSLAAASAVIDELKEKPVIKHCWELGKHFISKFNKIAEELDVNVKMEGLPVRSSIVCKDTHNKPSLLLKSLFYQETLRNGILFGPGAIFLSYSHSKKDIEKTLVCCEASMKILKNAIKNNNVKKSLKGQAMKQIMTF